MWNWITRIHDLTRKGDSFVIVTVTRCNGSTPRETGAKMLVLSNERIIGTIGGGQLEQQATRDALECLRLGTTKTITYPLYASVGQCCGGVVELLMETVNRNPVLYLFGAGHVGQALCRSLHGTSFEVHVIDERQEWIESDALPADVVRHSGPWQSVLNEITWDEERAYVAIMTHDHGLDLQVLQAVIAKPSRYLGMIGSQSKWKSFQNQLQTAGITENQLARVRCPIGIEIGGKSPQEVAISIAAELIGVHHRQIQPGASVGK
ncbi:MAG: xanthine dehydrogenase accessory protein XdhC [Bdellovibrionales bacterium GWB1_55_8]|nr:MAG: xanthine dehydrogenase accessory protein XdhC [Bdellovibrionales bacterium GWB1_55_8]